jgi:hypothetical protein
VFLEKFAALEPTDRTVFVMAGQQKERIAESLTAAGFIVGSDLLAAPHVLRVNIGISQGWDDCGNRSNVKYAYQRADWRPLRLSEKGWTGTCSPNVFDALSQRLAYTIVREIRSRETGSEG